MKTIKSYSKKKIRVLSLVACILVISFNIVWAINWHYYHEQIDGYSPMPKGYYKEGEEFIYTIKEPDYLNLTGNYAIWTKDGITLIIWPGLFHAGNYKYGVEIEEKEGLIRFYIDHEYHYVKSEEMNYTEEEEAVITELLSKNQTTLERLFNAANIEWELPNG